MLYCSGGDLKYLFNKELWLLDLLIEKDQKSVPIPIQHQYTFPYIKYNLVLYSQKVNHKLQNRPKNLFSSQNWVPLKWQILYPNIWELPPSSYNQAMMSRENFISILQSKVYCNTFCVQYPILPMIS